MLVNNQLPPLTLEAFQAMRAEREAAGHTDDEKGEWVFDHYRKKVQPLIDEEAFAKILASLERVNLFNLENFRDPYLMREGKLLRARLTPKILDLVGRVGEYNARGEVVPKGSVAKERKEMEAMEAMAWALVKSAGEKDEDAASGGEKIIDSEDKKLHPKADPPGADPAPPIVEEDPDETPKIETLTPIEVESLVTEYEALVVRLEELLEEEQEEEDGDDEYEAVRKRVLEEMQKGAADIAALQQQGDKAADPPARAGAERLRKETLLQGIRKEL